MATRKLSYVSTANTITITVNSLATSTTAARQSTIIDNSTNQDLDALIQCVFSVPTGGTIGSDKSIYVYVFGTSDGTNYGAERGVAGTQATVGTSDAAYTMTDPTTAGSPLILAQVVSVPVAPTTTAGTYVWPPFSLAACFGGIMPVKWGIVIKNSTNITLNSTGNSITYTRVQETIA